MPRDCKNTEFSYWEHKGWLEERDIVIIGAGFVGLSAAIECRKLNPSARLTILEASALNGGGSTRNAGFACFGSPSELLEDWRNLGRSETVALVKRRVSGLKWLLKEFGEEAIGYENCGSVEVFSAENAKLGGEVLAFLPELNEALFDVLGGTAFEVVAGVLGVDGCGLCVSSPFEGLLDTAALYREFLRKNINSGVDILNGVRVEEIVKSENGWELKIDGGVVETRQVLVANNSMASELIPEIDVRPEANRVLVTKVLPDLVYTGTCHHDRGYVYLRRIDTAEGPRMLIGGGRQWGDGDSDEVRAKLLTFLKSHIVGAEKAEVEYEWKGYLGIGDARNPICKTIQSGLHVGVRLGGMGVALGGELGVELARLARDS